jgi:hypothetical protein
MTGDKIVKATEYYEVIYEKRLIHRKPGQKKPL